MCSGPLNGHKTRSTATDEKKQASERQESKTAATHNFPDNSQSNGMLWWRSEYSTAHVVDGTSNTLLIGEKGFDPAFADSWQAGDPQSPYIGYDPDIYRLAGPNFPLHRDDPGTSGFWNFTGPHLGGCVFVYVDGSVHVIPWNVDLTVYGYLSNRRDEKAFTNDF